MTNNKTPLDNQLNDLYQQRKANFGTPDCVTADLHKCLAEKSEQATLLNSKYSHISFFKAIALAACFVVIALPLFSMLLGQVTKIQSSSNIAVHDIDTSNTLSTKQVATVIVTNTLPDKPLSTRPNIHFSAIVADSKQQKITAFNLQIESFLANNQQVLQQQQDTLYAQTVQKGRLIKQSDMWFIEFCGEHMQLLAFESIEASLLAEPLLDETRLGSFVDVYSNPTGIIAMLTTTKPLQCD